MSTVAQPQPPATPNGGAPSLDANMTPGSPGSQDESSIITDGRRGPRRELSTSKRAAQNRAAQRAFRQRKEGYIKKLEQQVREFGEMENQFKNLQSENFTLREYVIHLQSKIIDLKADMPQPPSNLNLGSVGMGHNLSGASAAAAAASLLSNAANAAALQRQQEQEQHAAAAAVAASGYTPAYAPAVDGTAAGPKNEASLARMAQAVAQFETGTVDAVAAAAAAAAAAAGAEKADEDAAGEDEESNDPMDTTPETAAAQTDAKAE